MSLSTHHPNRIKQFHKNIAITAFIGLEQFCFMGLQKNADVVRFLFFLGKKCILMVKMEWIVWEV